MTTLKGLQGTEADGKVLKAATPHTPQVGERLSGGLELWTVEEMASYLKVRPGTIYTWIYHGVIPVEKLNRMVRLNPREVLEALRQRGKEVGKVVSSDLDRGGEV